MAAETKNFLDEKMEPVSHKLMAKYIALAAVIFVILVLAVLAWFTSKQSADASGINVKTFASNGLQVAITDHNTETGKGSVWTDYADKWTYHSAFTSTNPLPLISGNGLQFFEPTYVKVADNPYQRLDLDELVDDGLEVTWTDVTDKMNASTEEKSDYIEYTMKFRNAEPSNVFLRSDSVVSPYDTSENHNPWHFSRDYIAATARVAFLKKDSNDALSMHSLWIPNEKMQLIHQDRSETEVTSYEEKSPEGTVKETAGTSGGVPTGGTATNLYAWWNSSDLYDGSQHDNMVRYYENMQKSPLMDKGDYYYCKMHAPESSLPALGDRTFFVTNGSSVKLTERSNGFYVSNKFDLIGRSVSKQYKDSTGRTVTVQFESDDYNLAFKKNSSNSYSYIINCEKVYVSPHTGEVDYYLIIDKQGNVIDVIIDDGTGGTEPSFTVDINKSVYVPDNDDVLLVSASSTTKNKGLTSSNGASIDVGMNPSGTGKPTWVVTDVSDNGSFKLKDSTQNKYLTITDSGLSLDNTGANFYAVTKYEKKEGSSTTTTNFNGVMLYSLENNLFVKFDGSKFTSSKTYDKTYTYHIYLQKITTDIQEGVWNIEENGDTESPFFYKHKDFTKKQAFATNQYFLSSNINDTPEYHENETVTTYPNFIVAINKQDDDGYYVSDEITVRIWGEGYDREAQTPVEGGRIKIDLHFFAVVEEKD